MRLPIYRLEWQHLARLASYGRWLRLPAYQRGYVWSAEQAVALVETIMMGLPIGGCILRETRDGVLVIDGQQRISTVIGMSMGNGGDVPEICVEYDPTAADDPLRSGGAHVRVVVGSGPGRVPVRMLTGDLQVYALAAAGEDVTQIDDPRSRQVDLIGAPFSALSDAEDMLRDAMMPALVFGWRATDAQVKEAFRRINLGGTPIEADALERLLAAEGHPD